MMYHQFLNGDSKTFIHLSEENGYLFLKADSYICDFILLSDGIGRTGVFCALCIVLERMRSEGVVDLFQTVKLLRTQRPNMIQNQVRVRRKWQISKPFSNTLKDCN